MEGHVVLLLILTREHEKKEIKEGNATAKKRII